MLNKIKQADVIDKFHFYYHLNTPRAKNCWERVQKIDKLFSPYAHKDLCWQAKIELFVQEMEDGYIEEEMPDPKSVSEF